MKTGLYLVLLLACLVGWSGCKPQTTKPSVLVTDAELMRKFGSEALPKNYNVIVRVTHWNLDGTKGRFERSFAGTLAPARHGRVVATGVIEMDNVSVDPQIVSDRFEGWLAKLVKVTSIVADTNSPALVGRIIRYTTKQTTGELRYTIKPVPTAVNGKGMPADFKEFDIQIVEERKHK
jgi:hypothetical protein